MVRTGKLVEGIEVEALVRLEDYFLGVAENVGRAS